MIRARRARSRPSPEPILSPRLRARTSSRSSPALHQLDIVEVCHCGALGFATGATRFVLGHRDTLSLCPHHRFRDTLSLNPRRPRQRVAGEPRLIGGLGVALDLAQRLPTPRRDLVGAASGFGEATASRLAQPVEGAALRQTGGVAPFAKLVAEIVRTVALAVLRDQEGEMAARRR